MAFNSDQATKVYPYTHALVKIENNEQIVLARSMGMEGVSRTHKMLVSKAKPGEIYEIILLSQKALKQFEVEEDQRRKYVASMQPLRKRVSKFNVMYTPARPKKETAADSAAPAQKSAQSKPTLQAAVEPRKPRPASRRIPSLTALKAEMKREEEEKRNRK